MSERMTPERLAEIRGLVTEGWSLSVGESRELFAEFQAVARERDAARKAGEWTDAMIDAACAVWDRHWATWDDALREEAREKIRDGVRAAMRVASSQPTPALGGDHA